MSEDTPEYLKGNAQTFAFDMKDDKGRQAAAKLLQSLFGSPDSGPGEAVRAAIESTLKDAIGEARRRKEMERIEKLPPLTRDDVAYLMSPSKHKIGDAVRWRDHKEYMNFPKPGQVVFVTRVFAEREEDGHLENMAVAVRVPCNGPDCKDEGHIIEVAVDGRCFEAVPEAD